MYTIFWLLLLIAEAFDANVIDRANKICRVYGYRVLKAKFTNEDHLLCLKLHNIGSSLATNKSLLFLDPDPNDEYVLHDFPLVNVTMAYGFPVEDPSAGSAEGYIGDDHKFHGVLHLRNRTLHADPYRNDDLEKIFGFLENDYMAVPMRDRRENVQYSASFEQSHLPYHVITKHQPGVARARICDLLLLADKEFYEKDASSSLNQVVQRMLHAVAQADIVFRNSDFNEDGIPDNIGFSVKYILVLTSNETNYRVFGNLSKKPIVDGRSYLMRFARLRRLSEVCLGVAFSGHAFSNKTLGLSFTSLGGGMSGAAGGLCDRRAFGRSFNTLALAHGASGTSQRVPERVAAVTLVHEMGHSFGAHHDDNFPNSDCSGYVMSSQSPSKESAEVFQFSLCSKRLITATLSSMSYCLSDVDKPYCGNGIVEEGEACDCGLPSRCSELDPCCTPRAGGVLIFQEGALHMKGCSVAPIAQCHPSQGLCCTAKCAFANLTKFGIDCTKQMQECTCGNLAECRCGLGGRCLPDGTCHAADCAILGLRECSCSKKVAGKGKKRCGVCCIFKSDDEPERCLSIETIALELMAVSDLPSNWPDEEYRGPNITLHVCNNSSCRSVAMRAWAVGDACVSLNAVGVCAPRGVCTLLRDVPSSNIYPLTNIKGFKQAANSAQANRNVILLYIIMLILILNF